VRPHQEIDDAKQREQTEHEHAVAQPVLGMPQRVGIRRQPQQERGSDEPPDPRAPHPGGSMFRVAVPAPRLTLAGERPDERLGRLQLLSHPAHANPPQTRWVSRRNNSAAPTTKIAAQTTTLAMAEGVNPVPVNGSRASSAMP